MTLVVPLGFGALLLSGSAGEGSSHALLGSPPSPPWPPSMVFRRSAGEHTRHSGWVMPLPATGSCCPTPARSVNRYALQEFLEGGAIDGITPFIGDLLQARGAGGLREAGFVIGGLGVGGLTMPPLRRSSSHSQPDR